MDPCGRSRRTRNQVACRRRGGSPTTDTSDSDADTDEDSEPGVCISPPWPTIRRRSRRRLNPRSPIIRPQYLTRERSRSPVTPSPSASRLVSPVVSLTRLPNLDALFAAGRVSWAPAPLVTEPALSTQSSTSDMGEVDSDSCTPPTIRIINAVISSEDEDETPPDGEDVHEDADEDDYTQFIESLESPEAPLFSSDDEELSEIYGVNFDHDYSEPEEDTDTWSPPSETVVSEPSTSARRALPPVTQDDGPLAGTLMELLECPVCYEPMQPPIWQCSRGHLVCRDCAPKLRRCPTCRCAAQRTRNCTLEKVSSALQYPCRNRQRGCPVHLPPAQLTAHEERECCYRYASCRVQSCSWRGEPAAAAAHARSEHAGLTRMLQLGRPVIMGVPVPMSSGQRTTRVLRLVESERVLFLHLQLNNSTNAVQWCSYVQEFGQEIPNANVEYRLDLDEDGAAEKRLVRPDIINEVFPMIMRDKERKIDARHDGGRATGAWRERTYRARAYAPTEVPDEAPGSSRTRCFSYRQIKKGLYISSSGTIKARIILTLWTTPIVRTQAAGDVPTSTATSAQS